MFFKRKVELENVNPETENMDNLEKKPYLSIGLSFGMLGIEILLALIFAPLVYFLPKYIGNDVSQLIYYVLMSGTALYILYSIRKKRSGEKSFSASFSYVYAIPFIILGGWALLFGAVDPLSELIPMPEFIKEAFAKSFNSAGIATFLMMVIAAPIFEELVYRGIILDGLLKRYSPFTAILVSSVLFGLIHLNPWQFVAGFIVGLFAGWVYYKTRNLTLTMILHATINFVGYLQIVYKDVFEKYETMMELYGGIKQYLFVITASIVLFVVCVLCLRKVFNKSSKALLRVENERNLN
jgi:membrane protease YdiL (CAAX protease family)